MRQSVDEGRSAQGLLDFITELFLEHGYLVVFVGSAGDNLGIPATGDAVMFAGGWLSSAGHTALGLVMFVGALGALVADNASYWAGRMGGRVFIDRVLKNRLLSRILSTNHMDRAECYFRTHGGKTVLIGRFAPGLRGPTPLFAGVSRMPYPRFLAFNTAAIVLWAVLSATLGYLFGEYWDELLATARTADFLIIAALLAALYVCRNHTLAKKRSIGEPPPEAKNTAGKG